MQHPRAWIVTRIWALWATREHGATAVEYALMAVFVAAVIVTAVTTLGIKTQALFTTANVGW